MRSTDENSVTGSILGKVLLGAVAVLAIYWLTQEFGAPAIPASDTVVTSESREYPKTPDSVESCPQHAEYVFRIMVLKGSGVTKEEVLAQEKARWEAFKIQNPNTDPAYWAWSEYAIAEAYNAPDDVMVSKKSMATYAVHYFAECVRTKKEEAEL